MLIETATQEQLQKSCDEGC